MSCRLDPAVARDRDAGRAPRAETHVGRLRYSSGRRSRLTRCATAATRKAKSVSGALQLDRAHDVELELRDARARRGTRCSDAYSRMCVGSSCQRSGRGRLPLVEPERVRAADHARDVEPAAGLAGGARSPARARGRPAGARSPARRRRRRRTRPRSSSTCATSETIPCTFGDSALAEGDVLRGDVDRVDRLADQARVIERPERAAVAGAEVGQDPRRRSRSAVCRSSGGIHSLRK